MTERLLVATHNRGKVAEYADMLAGLDIDWLSLADLRVTAEVDETGDTFLANAEQKAAGYATKTGILTLADDSGLEVDALGGEPGVRTARFGGAGLTSEERYGLLLANLLEVPMNKRTARFRCAIALAGEDGKIMACAEGAVEGLIALQPSGDGGFGYDPIFYIPGEGCTMAQITAEAKHAISHRGNALRAIQPRLVDLLSRRR